MNTKQINLVNWRDVRREKQTKKYIEINILIVCVLCAIFALIAFFSDNVISKQRSHNIYLKQEIKELNVKLKDINESENQIKEITARMEIINSLQSNKSDLVMLLDEIAKVTPKEITLTKLKRENDTIDIEGRSISQLNISTYLNNLKNSYFFNNPMLEQVIADKKVDGFERSRFFIKTDERKQSSLIKESNDERVN